VNLSTDGQRPGERMMLILGLRFLGRTRPSEHPKGRVFRSTWVENKKNASRMPPDQRSDMRTTLSTTRKSRERSGDVQPLGYGLRPGAKASHEIFELEPGPPPSLWKCGNRAFWVLARFPSAGGKRGKVQVRFRARSRRGLDFSTLSTARHFHSEYSRVEILRRLLVGTNGGRKILFFLFR